MTIELLKQDLMQIKINNYSVSHDGLYYEYALIMLQYIGIEDAELRDDLIYDIFSKWIDEDRFSYEQLEFFLQISMDEQHLMYDVGAQESNSVFTRTFSALIIASILHKNNEKEFLSPYVISQTKNKVIEYYIEEKDLRGYVGNSGWAHSVAHGADVIDELAKCSVLNKNDLQSLLRAIQLKVCQGVHVFIDGEIDRINVAVRSVLRRKLIDKEEVKTWLENFKAESYINWSINSYRQKTNIQNFFRSLYFTLKLDDRHCIFLEFIEKMISTL